MNDLVQAREARRRSAAAHPDVVAPETASFAPLQGWLFGRRVRALAYASAARQMREVADADLPHTLDIKV